MHRFAFLTTAVVVCLIAAPAWGGGASNMYPIEETYQAGDTVRAVGYVGSADLAKTYLATMNLVPIAPATAGRAARWHDLGPVTVGPSGQQGYLAYRVSGEFMLPPDLQPGDYEAVVVDSAGDGLIYPWLLVGIQPAEPPSMEWPLDEPMIAELPDEAVIHGPGFAVPAGDLRAGRYPPGGEEFMLHPERLPELKTETYHRDIHVPDIYDSEAGEAHPVTPSTMTVEPQQEGTSGIGLIASGIGLVAALVGVFVTRRSRPVDDASVEPARQLEHTGRP